MALRTGVAADECERRGGATEKTRPRRVTLGEQLPGSAARDDRDGRGSSNDYDPGTRKHCCNQHSTRVECRLLERKDALPVVLHTDHRPAILLRLVVERLCEGANLAVG